MVKIKDYIVTIKMLSNFIVKAVLGCHEIRFFFLFVRLISYL